MVTTLLEAAKAIQESARKGQAAINMPLLLDLEKAIAQEQTNKCGTCGWRHAGMIEAGLVEPQTASTKPVVSQKTEETVDKDCDTCNNRHSRLAGNEFYVGEDGERVETYMKHPDQIRGYASSRYSAAIDAMKGKS